jgi:hypothetical protein
VNCHRNHRFERRAALFSLGSRLDLMFTLDNCRIAWTNRRKSLPECLGGNAGFARLQNSDGVFFLLAIDHGREHGAGDEVSLVSPLP